MTRIGPMEIVFLDVGQGDAALIKTPEGHHILIDGGPDSRILEKMSVEIPFWKREIDLIILTHPHHDHLNGLIDVISNYDVRTVIWNGVSGEGSSFIKWEEAILESDVIIARAGQRVKGKTFHLDILYPFQSLEGEAVKDLNTTSVVVRLVSVNGSFLFTGDAYASNEKELIEMEDSCAEERNEYWAICRVMVLDSDVLKIGHHGSRTSTSEDFIKRVMPSIAVISSGKGNSYGHPHKEILELLEYYDIRVLRTDLEGDIKIIK